MRIPEFPWSRFPSDADHAPQARRRAWLFWGGLLLLVIFLVMGAGWAWPRMQARSAERALQRAEELVEAKDFRQAQLYYEQVVQLHPRHFDARRRLAAFYARGKSPEALAQWKEVARLEPDNDANWFGLTTAALQFGDVALARSALDRVSVAGRRTAEYQRDRAGVALAAGDLGGLAAELDVLIKREPGNQRARFTRAALLLLSKSPEERRDARAQLEQMARGDELRIRATLVLLRVAQAGRGGLTIAEVVARISPDGSGNLDAVVARMKAQPAPSAPDALELAQWLLAEGRVGEVAEWLGALPEATRDAFEIKAVRAEAAARLGDWALLEKMLIAGAWGALPPGMIESAFDARELWLKGETSRVEAGREWDEALRRAGKSRAALDVLVRLAGVFAWPKQLEATLLRVVEIYPTEGAAWEALVTVTERQGDSTDALEYYDRWAAAMPDSGAARSREALISVLLNNVDARTRETLKNEKLQSEPALAAARLLRRWQKGEKVAVRAEALALPASIEIKHARVRLVLAFLWADAGDFRRSEDTLASLKTDDLFFEEERKLLESAKVWNRENRAAAGVSSPAG